MCDISKNFKFMNVLFVIFQIIVQGTVFLQIIYLKTCCVSLCEYFIIICSDIDAGCELAAA